jgi:general secretion pathway protein J
MNALQPPAARGFTLLELLVAITVLSLVSLISWRGLESLTATRNRLEPEAEEVRAMLTVFGQMELDVAQVVNPVFVPLPAAPVNLRAADGGALEIVRFAPAASDEASAVQVVVYRVSDGRLVREVTPPLRQIGLVAKSRFSVDPLLANVRSMRVRYWRTGQGWIDAAAATATPENPTGVPPGIEVTLERSDGTRLRRVFVTA